MTTWDRVTDWRYLLGLCGILLVVAVILASVGSLSATSATHEQLATSNDQVKVLRAQRDAANRRADATSALIERVQGTSSDNHRLILTLIASIARFHAEQRHADCVQARQVEPGTELCDGYATLSDAYVTEGLNPDGSAA